jgi:Tol biopolymer transport system component
VRQAGGGLRVPRVAVLGVLLLSAAGTGCRELEEFQKALDRMVQRAPKAPAAASDAATPHEPAPRLEDVAEEVQITTDPSPELWPRVTSDGKALVFASQKTGNFELFALEFASPRLQHQLTTSAGNKCRTTLSPDGKSVLFDRVGPSAGSSVFRMTFGEGRDTALIERAIHVLTPDLSPDGRRIAFGLAEATADPAMLLACRPPLHEALAAAQPSLWVARADGSGPIYVGPGLYPRWSRDGKRLAFVSMATGNADVWTVNADGSELTQVTVDTSHEIDPEWSPDGTRLVFSSDRRTRGNFDLWMLDLRDGKLVQLTADPGHDGGPAWSPEGRYIYFHGFRNRNWDIYRVAPLPR